MNVIMRKIKGEFHAGRNDPPADKFRDQASYCIELDASNKAVLNGINAVRFVLKALPG